MPLTCWQLPYRQLTGVPALPQKSWQGWGWTSWTALRGLVHRRGELGAPAPSWGCWPCPWEGSRALARRQGLALLPFTPTTPRGTFFSSPAIIFPHPYCCAPFFVQPGGRRPLVLCAMHYADFISASNTYTALHYDWIIFCHRYVADRTIFLPSLFL